MRYRKTNKPSPRGTPPHAHVRNGLKEINFDVQGNTSMIGPRKFARSNFFHRPVPNIHEKGGTAISMSIRTRRGASYYPERSFMWRAVKKLKQDGKIESRFNATLRSFM